MIKFRTNRSGFTLLELIISLGITLVITGIVIANFQQADRNFALRQATLQLESNLRRMKLLSLAGSQTQGSVPLGGYGLWFSQAEPQRYILFADFDGNREYDLGEELSDGLVQLPMAVTIKNLSPAARLTLVFSQPQAKIFLNQHEREVNFVAITLEHAQTHSFKVVVLNTLSGQVNIQ